MVEDQATIAPPHKDEDMMQRDEYNSDFCIPLYHDEVAATSEERISINENPNTTIIIEDRYEPSSLASGKVETKIH